MPLLSNAVLCGLVGAILAHVAYVRSNLFVLGDVTRLGRHPLWDPVFFDGLGLLAGVVVGIIAAKYFSSSPAKSLIAGLGITLLSISVIGGVSTARRYSALPKGPSIEGRRVTLEFELRAPVARNEANGLPSKGALSAYPRKAIGVVMQPSGWSNSEGRAVIAGSVPLAVAESPRLLNFDEGQDVFVNFMLPLAAEPIDADTAWTEWMSAVNIAPESAPTDVFQIRYRVRFAKSK